MGEKWRVTVERFEDGKFPGEGDWAEVATLAASREQLARFAPGVVADALGTNTAALVHTAVAIDTASGQPIGAPGGITFTAEPAGTSTKRKRRTKAEMEVDRLAEQTSAEEAVTNAGPDPYQPGDPVKVEPETPPAPVPDAPFNPFAPK